MSGQIDKFGRKRRRIDESAVRGYKIKNGNFDVENRQFVNVREPNADDNLVTLDYFSKHRFDFENKQAHAIADPEQNNDAANKQYVDESISNHHRKTVDSLQTTLSKSVKAEVRRLLSTAAAGERTADDEFEEECNIGSLVRNELSQIRCALVYQFFGRVDLDKSKEYYVINNDRPFIGIIFDCKVLYAWITPTDLTAFTVRGGTHKYYTFNQAIDLQGKELTISSVIQFKLKTGVDEISGTLVLQYQPWMLNDQLPVLPEKFLVLETPQKGIVSKRIETTK